MKPFNPLDKQNLGISVVRALLSQTLHPLPPSQKFKGAGVYAIYYAGAHELYRSLNIQSDDDTEKSPIYVGKAVPAGARMGILGETLLIEQFRPIWNVLVPGFGNHDPGKGRYNQQRSAWDTLHPGRQWAAKLKDYPKTRDQIAEEVRQALTIGGNLRP